MNTCHKFSVEPPARGGLVAAGRALSTWGRDRAPPPPSSAPSSPAGCLALHHMIIRQEFEVILEEFPSPGFPAYRAVAAIDWISTKLTETEQTSWLGIKYLLTVFVWCCRCWSLPQPCLRPRLFPGVGPSARRCCWRLGGSSRAGLPCCRGCVNQGESWTLERPARYGKPRLSDRLSSGSKMTPTLI